MYNLAKKLLLVLLVPAALAGVAALVAVFAGALNGMPGSLTGAQGYAFSRLLPRHLPEELRSGDAGEVWLESLLGSGVRAKVTLSGSTARIPVDCDCSSAEQCAARLGGILEDIVRTGNCEESSAKTKGCSCLHPDTWTVVDASGSVRGVCPGQWGTLAEGQIHDALFSPALPPSATERGALQPPEGDLLSACSGSRTNCFVYSDPRHYVYCGRIDSDARINSFGADGSRPVTSDDIYLSNLYLRALASAEETSRIGREDHCPARSASTFISALVVEVITADTMRDFAADLAQRISRGNQFRAAVQEDLFTSLQPRLSQPDQVCFHVEGLSRGAKEETATLRAALAFPVFGIEEAAPGGSRAGAPALSPLLTRLRKLLLTQTENLELARLYRVSSSASLPQGSAIACEQNQGSSRPICDWLCRTCRQAKRIFGTLRSPEDRNAHDLPRYIAGSGPFHTVAYSKSAHRLKTVTSRPDAMRDITLEFNSVQPGADVLREKVKRCEGRRCLFHAVWNEEPFREAPACGSLVPVDEHPSFIGVFGLSHTSSRCVRHALNLLWDEMNKEKLDVVLAPILGANVPSGGIQRSLLRRGGLLPANVTPAVAPFADPPAAQCQNLRLAHPDEDRWTEAAKELVKIFAAVKIGISSVPLSFEQLTPDADRGSSGAVRSGADLLLAPASMYTSRELPTLAALVDSSSPYNFSGRALPPDARPDWKTFEATIIKPTPWIDVAGYPRSRPEALASVEAAVYYGEAPLQPLAFKSARSFTCGMGELPEGVSLVTSTAFRDLATFQAVHRADR